MDHLTFGRLWVTLLMGRANKQISAERKEHLKSLINKEIRTLCDNKTSDSKYLFGENLLESMKEA